MRIFPMKNKSKITLFILIILIFIFGVLISIPVKKEETIKIGAMLILSGEGAAWGQASQRAIDLAVEETNNARGINGKQIEVVYEDTQGSAPKAVSAYNKLKEIDKVTAIIGPLLQTEMGAIAPLADKDKFPVISPSYTSISNRQNPRNPLRIWLDPTIEAEQMAEYVYKQNIKTIAVLGTEDSWEKEVSTAFANKFKALGGTVYVTELLQPDEVNVRTTVLKATKNNPDAIFLGTYFQFLNLARVLKEFDYKGKLYSIEIDEYLAQESKESTSGLEFGLEFISSELYKDTFRKKFEEKYGEKSNIPAGQSYDAINILISFLKKSTSKKDILKEMETFTSYDGVSGTISITPDNKTIIPTSIYELQDGKIKVKSS